MGLRQPSSSLGAPAQARIAPVSIPASVGGINALDSFMAMPPEDCIYSYNMMPVEYGLRLRKGYGEWCIGLTDDVRTIIGYESTDDGTTLDRLFAVTAAGIYNISNRSNPVDQMLAFDPVPAGLEDAAGYGVKTEFTTDAPEHYLFYADYVHGVWQYKDDQLAPQEWVRPTWGFPVGGPALEDIAFVTVHKQRIWIIEENSSDAWYSGVASIAGNFTKFTFGSKMPHGGNLQGIYTWSLDGGDGLDDYLVAVSHGGDVLVYRGGDPINAGTDSDPWTLVGSWFIGETPNSRRLAASFGSEMYLLSTFGLTNLRDLLEGSAASAARTSPSAKINRFLRADMDILKEAYEWAVNVHPADGFLQIVAPAQPGGQYRQYNQNLNTKSWGFWEGVPVISADTWNGDYYIGSLSGVTHIYEGSTDGATLAGDTGEPISFRGLTSFQAIGSGHGTYKNVGLIRSIGAGTGTTNIRTRAVYDYDISAIIPSPTQTGIDSDSVWDASLWDEALWDGGLSADSSVQGSAGIGRAVACGFSGNAATRVTLIGWDYMFTEGGLL